MFKKKPEQTVFPENSKYKVGDVVEFLRNNIWQVGEVQKDYQDKELLVWPLSGNDYGRLHEVPVRRTEETIKKATAYYKEMIDFYQARIDHRSEKEQIAEYKSKIARLASESLEPPQ